MKKSLALCLMFSVGVVPVLPASASEVVVEEYQDEDQQKSDRDAQREAAIKEKAELMGLGTEVKVAIRDVYSGRNLLTHRGIIAEISDEHLGLQVGDRILQIKYSQIETLTLAKAQYKSQGQWERIFGVQTKRGIEVYLQNGEKLKGAFVGADQNGIVLETKADKSMRIGRQDVLRISQRSRGKAALIGLGVGAGSGFGIGASGKLVHDSGMTRSEAGAIGAVLFGLIGAAVGGIIGMEDTIYQSPTVPSGAKK